MLYDTIIRKIIFDIAGISATDSVIQDTTAPESIIIDLNSEVVDWEVKKLSPEDF